MLRVAAVASIFLVVSTLHAEAFWWLRFGTAGALTRGAAVAVARGALTKRSMANVGRGLGQIAPEDFGVEELLEAYREGLNEGQKEWEEIRRRALQEWNDAVSSGLRQADDAMQSGLKQADDALQEGLRAWDQIVRDAQRPRSPQ